MRKSVIIATVTIIIAVALVATYVWYGDDGGDGGSDTPENTEPVLSNYINTSQPHNQGWSSFPMFSLT